MLVFACKVHDLGDLGLGDFVAKRPANADALLMNMKHNPGGFIDIHLEKALQHEHDKLHRCVVVVEDQNFIRIGLLGLGPRFRRDANIGIVAVSGAIVTGAIIIVIPGHKLDQPKGFSSREVERVGVERYGGENLCFNHVPQDMVF